MLAVMYFKEGEVSLGNSVTDAVEVVLTDHRFNLSDHFTNHFQEFITELL
jgi:hypothetical protein